LIAEPLTKLSEWSFVMSISADKRLPVSGLRVGPLVEIDDIRLRQDLVEITTLRKVQFEHSRRVVIKFDKTHPFIREHHHAKSVLNGR